MHSHFILLTRCTKRHLHTGGVCFLHDYYLGEFILDVFCHEYFHQQMGIFFISKASSFSAILNTDNCTGKSVKHNRGCDHKYTLNYVTWCRIKSEWIRSWLAHSYSNECILSSLQQTSMDLFILLFVKSLVPAWHHQCHFTEHFSLTVFEIRQEQKVTCAPSARSDKTKKIKAAVTTER